MFGFHSDDRFSSQGLNSDWIIMMTFYLLTSSEHCHRQAWLINTLAHPKFDMISLAPYNILESSVGEKWPFCPPEPASLVWGRPP